MPTQTLLEITSEELFQKHGISEIIDIQVEIQHEIEKKREELRTMVGEKCRDLLKAADTITEMKETSQQVVLGINKIKQLCETLQYKKSIGFGKPNNNVNRLSSNAEEISKIIEIKVLLVLPEQIWTAIDKKDYLLGSQLFLFATHLHLGLEVTSSAMKISNKYPVLSKQWEIISNCKKTLVDGAHNELKVIGLSHQKAVECLCSLVLLEVMSYEKLLNQYLSLRFASLKDVINSDELSRKKLRLVVELLQNTLSTIFVCFAEKPGKKYVLQDQLNSITGDEEKPTLTKIIEVSSLPEIYLSPLVLHYRPKTTSKLTILSQDYIKFVVQKWLEKVENLLQLELTKLLLLIDDIKRLHKIIKEEVTSLEYPKDWDEIVEHLLGNSKLNIYEKFIKSYVTKRVKELIMLTWETNTITILNILVKMDEDSLKDRGKQPESDIRWFVWKERKPSSDEDLKLKTLGYTSRVMELCKQMNIFLNQLLEDVKLYVGINSSSKSKSSTNSDTDLILPYLNSCSLEMLKRFTKSVKESYREREDANNESNIIIRARYLTSLTKLCPGLKKCLKHNTVNEDFEKSEKQNMWQQANVFLREECFQMWSLWSDLMALKLRRLIKMKLDAKISLRNLLKSKPLSEIITIEEQTEDGATVKSDLRVPSQPSLPLQELLFQICQQLNKIIPHTLPKNIHQNLVNTVIKDILEHYQEWSKSEIIYQSQAWQMLLDIKFLTLLIVTRENKDLSQSICECLEKTIDPFDLDVFFPHLQNSVKKSTQKLQGTYGILINHTEKLPVFNGLKLSQMSANSKVEEPNLMAVSSNVPWFPLLPVTNFGLRRSDSIRTDNQNSSPHKELSAEKGHFKSREKENKKESVTSDFFKSAGAFFDAVTGGWS